ncbi:MAG TPA: methyltransferase domain-containing protein [Sphingomonas sp.]|nr:methyltransferase domain-containing protein [Sphingomonas sp.]
MPATLGIAAVALAVTSVATGQPASLRSEIARAVAETTRTPANVARDRYRHPTETLAFFGVKPTDTVVELIPGGGWYTEILAPYVAQRGTYYAAGGMARGLDGVKKLQAANPAIYGKIKLAAFPAAAGEPTVPADSADVVLTFRNVHNLRFAGIDRTQAAFAEMFRMLKPGGTLGIVEHRLPENRDSAAEEKSGYMKTSSVVAFAEKAGFKLAGKSEVNANPKDTADWPEGVWTLPPTYRLKDVDREKYAAIGESDRMTLKFVKPKR